MEKLSSGQRMTYILVGVLAVVVLVVAVLVLTYPDESVAPTGSAGGMNSVGTDGSAQLAVDEATAGQGVAVATEPAQPGQGNTFCRSYVYKRCNELVIGPSDCRGIADAAGDVPQSLGLAGCRSVVDEILARVAGIPEENVVAAPAVGGVVVDEGESDVKRAEGPGDEPGRESEDEAGAGQASPAGEPGQPVSGPDPASVATAMERLRQLETEIAFARNNYVGTNIGVQSRLDEMRAIVDEIGTTEAKEAYNAMLVKIGRGTPETVGASGGSTGAGSAGTQPSPPSGGVVVSQPVAASPASAGQAQVVIETAAPAAVVEAAPSSF